MKKSTLILVVLALFACTMAATATYSGGYAEKNPDKAKECGSKDGHHDGMFVICQEICDEDNCSKHAGGVFDKCQEHNCLQCIVKEVCEHCGKTALCDGICEECGEPCAVYEYCPSCGAKYLVGHADAHCDVCGKDCFCFEKCENCGHSQYFNGFCDECASKCELLRCCINVCGMQDHDSSCNCKEHAQGCDNAPKKCDCKNDKSAEMGSREQSGFGGPFEQPIASGNLPQAQGETTIVIMPLDALAAGAS